MIFVQLIYNKMTIKYGSTYESTIYAQLKASSPTLEVTQSKLSATQSNIQKNLE